MRQNALILSLITMICLNVGCSLDDPPKLGQPCGQSPYTELLGIVSNNLSELSAPDADMVDIFKKYKSCTVAYPNCIYPTNGRYAWDTGNGFACSICSADELYCDVNTGGKKCIPVLNDPTNCGECGNRCSSGICYKGTCIDPNAEDTCGASIDNPNGSKCTGDLRCIDKDCKCPSGTLCDGHCINLNLDERCGTTCDNAVACNTDENQTCQSGTCVCPDGYLLREGHCIDPKVNNKYCGATENSNGEQCDLNSGLFCNDGKCTCLKGGYVKNNDNKCVDGMNDSEQCGTIDGELVKCQNHSTCIKGKCICDDGYINIGGNCSGNNNKFCGARGDANVNNPRDINYQGYECTDGTVCGTVDTFVVVEGNYQAVSARFCAIFDNSQTPTWNPALNVFNQDGEVSGYADPNRVMKCERELRNGKYYTKCTCLAGFSGALCRDTIIRGETCENFDAFCEGDLMCIELNSPGGLLKTCGCSERMARDGSSFSCKDESREHCSRTLPTSCSDNEICSNSTCKPCGYNQTICQERCMDNYDLNPETGELVSFSERHIVACDLSSMTCEDGYSQCNHSFGCDDSCCLSPNKMHVESYNGEFKDARCCHKAAPRKCRSGNTQGQNQYTCQSKCSGYETDVTDD